MGGSSSQVVGYRYYAKFAAFIGNRIENLIGVNFDNRKWVFHDPLKHPPNLLPVLEGNLFGENEGGVSGNIDIHFGTPDQEPNAEYQKYFTLVSGYPYQSYLVFRGLTSTNPLAGKQTTAPGFYLGNSGYMKEMLFWVKRIHVKNNGDKQWYDEKAEIPDGGGVETPPITPEDEPLPAPQGVETLFTWDDEGGHMPNPKVEMLPAIYRGDEVFELSGKSISNIPSPHGSASLSSKTSLPYGRYVGIAKVARSPGVSLSMVGATFKENVPGFEIYNIDFVGEDFSVYMSGASVETIGLPSVLLAKYHAGDEKILSGDINPIHKIREIFTDDTAMGKPESDVNNANFMKAANRIWSEGLGVSWAIDEKSCIEAIEELCYHIEAGIRVNRQTGLYEIVLFRDDWFAEDEIHDISENRIKDLSLEVMNSDDIVNQLNVTYYDRERIKNSTFSVYENGSILTMGHANAESVEFPYFMNMRNAEIVANWKLKQFSTPAWSGNFTTGWSEARKWNRYDLIRLPWSKKWNGTILVRIMKINLGNGTNNTVTIDFEEVIPYSGEMNTSIVVDAPVESAPQPPQPCQYEPFELPYYLAVMALGQRQVDDELAYESNFGLVGVVAEQPQSNSLYAIMKTHNGVEGEEWLRAASIQYSETADLDQILSKTSSNFTVKNWKKLTNVSAGTLIKCGRDWLGTPGEWMVFQGIDPYTGIISVKRGALDTLPQEWGVDSKLYFCGDDIAYDANEYVLGEEILVSALTTTPSGVLEQKGSIPVEIQARAIRPYPPANVKINDVFMPLYIDGDLQLTWSDRNRSQQTGGQILGYFEGSVALESNTQTLLTVIELDANNVELATHSVNVTASNSFTLLESAMQADTRSLGINLKTVRDGYVCMNVFDHIVKRSTLIAPSNVTFEVIEY